MDSASSSEISRGIVVVPELLLEGHDELDQVERVCVQVFGE